MLSRFKFVCLLAVSSFCAGTVAAQTPTVRVARENARAEADAPHPLWKDVRVEFEGNRLFTSERLRALTNECYGAGNAEEEFEPEKLDYCLRMDVLSFLRRSGYVRAQLGETRAERTSAGETVTVPLDEKELYRLGEVRIEGAEFFTPARLREMLPLRRGDIADGEAVVRWLSEHVKKLYADEGFIQYVYDVEPAFNLNTDTGEGVADVLVTVDEGRRFKLRRLTFVGGGDVPEATLRAAMLIKEGEVFGARRFADSIERVNQLRLFGALDADKDTEYITDEETAELDIKIRLAGDASEPATQSTQPEAPVAEERPAKPRLKVRRPQTREE